MEYKVLIESISASDSKAVTEMQKKINQWITAGILKKYHIYTTSEYIVFNILKKKES